MIQLISPNNVALVLDSKTKIRVEWNSGLFTNEVIQGDIVYWFDIPDNPTNIKELGHANDPGISGKTKILDFRLILLGCISMTGKLIVSTYNEKFRCAFTTNNLQEYKEKLLNEIDFGSDISLGSTQQDVIDHANGKLTTSYPTSNYVFPIIKNEDLYDDKNPAYVGYMNNYDWENDTHLQNYLEDPDEDEEAPDGIINKYPLVPQFFLRFILDNLFAEIGYDHFGAFISDSDYAQMLLFNAFCLDDNYDEYWIHADNGCRDPMETYPQGVYFQGNFSIGAEMTGCIYGWGFKIVQKGWHQARLKIKATAPDPVTELNVRITAGTMFTNDVVIPAGEALNEEIVENIHTFYAGTSDIGQEVFCAVSSDWTLDDAELNVVNLSQTNLNRYAKTISPANHVPAIAINDFLNNLRKYWQMAVIIDSSNQQAEFLFLKDVFDTKAIDFTDKIEAGNELESIDKKTITVDFDWDKDDNFLDTSIYNDRGDYDQYKNLPVSRDIADIALMNPANAIFKVYYIDFQNLWKRFSDIDQKQTYGDGDDEEEITLGMHPAFMTGYIHGEDRGESQFLFALPQVNKQGKSKLFSSENDEDSILKLMNWIGSSAFEKLDENDDYYPFATSHNVNSKGGAAGTFSLFLDGTNGLAEIFHEDWLEFLKDTETYNFKAGKNFKAASLLKLLSLVKPQNVSAANQYRWLMIESIKYLPKQITAEVSMNGLESVEIKGVKQAYYNDQIPYYPH